MANRWGNNGNIVYFLYSLFPWAPNHFGQWLQPRNEKMLAPWKKTYDKSRQHIKKKRQYFANKGPSSQSYGFSSSHVCMWELDHKESWALKNWLSNSVAGSFPVSQLFASGGQIIEASTSASVLPNIQGWFPLGLTVLILQSKGLSRVFSSTTVQKHQFFGAQPSLGSNSHICTWLLEY